MNITYYRDSVGGYHALTTMSPKGFANCVLVGRGPEHRKGPETVKEQAYAVNQVERLDKVDPADVPDEWFKAIGYEERPEPVAPEPEPVAWLQPYEEPAEMPQAVHGLMADPWFWPLVIIALVILSYIFRGCI